MKRLLLLIVVAVLLSSCGLLPDWFATPTPTPKSYFETPCAFQWATQPLPDISASLDAAMKRAKIDGVTISASAFGENCINPDGSLRGFGAMETDYALTISSDQLATALAVLVDEAAQGRAGPKPGRITLQVGSGDAATPHTITFKTAADAVAQGLRGETLLAALRGP